MKFTKNLGLIVPTSIVLAGIMFTLFIPLNAQNSNVETIGDNYGNNTPAPKEVVAEPNVPTVPPSSSNTNVTTIGATPTPAPVVQNTNKSCKNVCNIICE